jgi:hypothetical protein
MRILKTANRNIGGTPCFRSSSRRMNEELQTTTRDEEDMLQKLRDENAERWKCLKEYHHQQDDGVNDNGDSASNSMLRRISQLNNATGAGDIDNADDERRYSIELVESYHELIQTNAILRQSIERERGRLRKMQDWKEQHQRVHETLRARHLEKTNSDREHAQVDIDEPVSHEKLQLENQRLKDNLRYVAEYIQKEREAPPVKAKTKQSTNQLQQPTDEATGRGAEAVTYWSLDQLIFKLMERLRSSPEDPYLLVDVSPIDTEHVALLSRCHMLETFKDDINMIKLIDYGD